MKKKVIFMGTPQIAVPSLQALIDAGFDVPLVLSQPDRPKGRGNKLLPTPIKEVALANDISVYQPEKIRNNQELMNKLKSLNPDFFAVVAYGKILPKEILDIPKYAPVNVHFSLLPKYRGAAPVNWAVMDGEEFTGVSTMKMDVGMDTGDILLVEKTPILRKTSVDLAEELSVTGAELLVKTLDDFENVTPEKQNDALQCHAPMMSKEDGLIDWQNSSATKIERMIRAFQPWPTAYTYLEGKILKLFVADVVSDKAKAGEIAKVGKDAFTVGTQEGCLVVKELQLEGKRRMTAAEFLAGSKLTTGMKLG